MKKMSDRQKVLAKMEKITGIKTIRKKTLTPPQLKRKYEHRLRDLIIIRDGEKCAIANRYHECKGRLVADHRPVKRGNNRYFFDPRNLTCVCASANFLAEFDPAVSSAICEVVRMREGYPVYEMMVATKGQPFRLDEAYVLGAIEKLSIELENGKE